jgi:hypothetical protein
MPSPEPKPLRTRGGFLQNPTTTTISLELDLHSQIQRESIEQGISVSRWFVDAAKRKLRRKEAK